MSNSHRAWMPRYPAAALLIVVAAGLVLSPLASLVHIAWQGDPDIWGHLAEYVLPVALYNTSLLLLGVGAIAAVAGVGTAWLVTMFEFPGRNAFAWLLPLPLAFPTYIVAYVYVDVFDALEGALHPLLARAGLEGVRSFSFFNIRSLGGAVFVMGFVLYPYVYLATRALFQMQSVAMIEVARTLGARPWRLARDISLPLARPAIAVGLALALLETLNDIGASEYLGVRTLTLSIFTTWLNRGSLPGAAQIACVMLVAIVGLIALERYGRRHQSANGTEANPRFVSRLRLAGGAGWIAAAACLVPVALGFFVPFAYLARQVFVQGLLTGFDPGLVRHVANTIFFAGAATLITLAIGFALVVALRLRPARWRALGVALATLGYAVPGTVLALGLLTPLVAVDAAINSIANSLAGVTVGLVLIGSGGAVILAYVIRFLAIAVGLAQAGLGRVSTELDDAARIVGARPFNLVRTIQFPLSRPALWGAALLVFVDCLKELPATLLLRPLNVETLSTYIYQFATRGSFEEGSLAALLIVAVGIFPVIYLVRHADDLLTPKATAMPDPELEGRRLA